MKLLITLLIAVSLSYSLFGEKAKFKPTENDAIALVEKTAEDIKESSLETFKKIIQGQKEYWNRSNRDFLVFVLDVNVKVVAHPRKMLMLRNCSFIKDVNGKKYRADAVSEALKKGDGWVSYSLKIPKVKGGGACSKKTYYKLVKLDDNKKYIVCCDIKLNE